MNDENTAVEVEVTTADIGEILDLARSARSLRGLPRPRGFPADGWYSKQGRTLADGERAVYLMYRWRTLDSNKGKAKSLGRLDDAKARPH